MSLPSWLRWELSEAWMREQDAERKTPHLRATSVGTFLPRAGVEAGLTFLRKDRKDLRLFKVST